MEEEKELHITELDKMYDNDNFNLLKVAMPYVASDMRKTLALWIKTSEVINTVKFFDNKDELAACNLRPKKVNSENLLHEMKTAATPKQAEVIDMMMNFMKANEFYSKYQETSGKNRNMMNLEGLLSGGKNRSSMIEMLKETMSPEQRANFETISMLMNNM